MAKKFTKHWSDLSNLTSADHHHLGQRLNAVDMDEVFNSLLDKLRAGSLRRWKRNVRHCFYKWYETEGKKHPDHKDILQAGEKTIAKADQALLWEWDMGSALFFWRWPKDYQDVAEKGIAPMFDSTQLQNRQAQPLYADEEIQLKVNEKLDKVIEKGYIAITDIKFVEAIMYMFHVAKGEDI